MVQLLLQCVLAHFQTQAFVLYIGVGASWMIVFNSKDAFVQDLKIKNAIEPVAQIGLDISINPRWSAVIDIKKSGLIPKRKVLYLLWKMRLCMPILMLIHWRLHSVWLTISKYLLYNITRKPR
ncbi:OmpW family outer membrane protein [Acinetobacter ursingii]